MNAIDKFAKATKNSFDRVDNRLVKLDKKIDVVRSEVDALRSDMNEQVECLRSEMNEKFKEVIHHFDVTAENIHQDVTGANKDEISLIKQKQDNLEERVTRVEEKVGV